MLPISYSILKALCKKSSVLQWQKRWLDNVRDHRGSEYESLARLRPTVEKWKTAFIGTRAEQTCLAKLRLGHCGLNHCRSRFRNCSPQCDCGAPAETVHHFLLECPLFARQRKSLFTGVRALLNDEISEDVLLGNFCKSVAAPTQQAIVSLVHQFVCSTGKKI